MSPEIQCLERGEWEAAELMRLHPPVIRDRNKRVVFRIACPPDRPFIGRVEYSRWRGLETGSIVFQPAGLADGGVIVPRFYRYEEEVSPGFEAWYVNFADPELFVAYGSSLLAQDELQAAEHPVMGALRETLLAEGYPARGSEGTEPTPILVRGLERRCKLATDPDAARGRPGGLYGNAFGRASPEAIESATSPVFTSTPTNLIAMAAPGGGSGPYRREEIAYCLKAALTGFRAAVLDSTDRGNPPPVIHSGLWGCGAFGGNRELMILVQLVAASLAGAAVFVLHLADAAGREACQVARETLRGLEGPYGLDEFVEALVRRGYRWGVSDGN